VVFAIVSTHSEHENTELLRHVIVAEGHLILIGKYAARRELSSVEVPVEGL
jgi:hypothetical protein